MGLWPTTFEGVLGGARAYLRRHWRSALQVRQKLLPSEDALHLLLAGGVGVIGGLINLIFYWAVEGAQSLFSGRLGRDLTAVVAALDPPTRVLVPNGRRIGGRAGFVLGVSFCREISHDQFAGSRRGRGWAAAVSCGGHPGDFLADQHQHGGVHRKGRGHHPTLGHGGVEVGPIGALAAVSSAAAGGVRRGGRNVGGL